MKTFLASIAEAYLEKEAERLVDYVFIFPNKRSAAFFYDAFATIQRTKHIPALPPAMMPINDWMERMYQDKGIRADRMEMVFLLYEAYREVVLPLLRDKKGVLPDSEDVQKQLDFNNFSRWSDTLISDFNDVDMALANAEELFKNVKDLRGIQAEYITPDQLKALKKYFGSDAQPGGAAESGTGNLWHKPSAKYKRLWDIMFPLYEKFRDILGKKGIFYPGMAYRFISQDLAHVNPGDLQFKRYIFVGFNNLTRSEEEIFTQLRKLGIADFYWDDASPVFRDHPEMRISQKMRDYVKNYPSRYPCVKPIEQYPKITIWGLPSKSAETKGVARAIEELYPADEPVSGITLRNTAVILPLENTYTGLLYAIPDHISPINITMGYKLRNTQVAELIRAIVSMQIRSRRSNKTSDGGATFFHEDVRAVVENPLMRSCVGEDLCNKVILQMDYQHVYNVPASWFNGPDAGSLSSLAPVFQCVAPGKSSAGKGTSGDEEKIGAAFGYLEGLMRWLLARLSPEEEEGEEEKRSPSVSLQRGFVQAYLDAVERLRTLVRKYLVTTGNEHDLLANITVFALVEKMVSGETIHFEGEPLVGLQIMGVLEARALDFENVIIPNMNEKIFPKNQRNRSLIPNNLRAAFHMTTSRQKEMAFNYYFYRMISRAKRVYLLYDSRRATRNGPMSRYVMQLIFLFRPDLIIHEQLSLDLLPPSRPMLEVEKDERVLREIDRFFTNDEDRKRHLSASTINQYMNCPLSFYLQQIAGYKREDQATDYVDDSTFGSVVHYALQKMYDLYSAKHPQGIIFKDTLDAMANDVKQIDFFLKRAFNDFFYHKGKECDDELKGDAEIYSTVMRESIKWLLIRDKDNAPFQYLSSEHKDQTVLHLDGTDEQGNPKHIDVNFSFTIDRVDQKLDATTLEPEKFRIVDYKTGSEGTSFSEGVKQIFDPKDISKRAKSLLQLMLYCQAWEQTNPNEDKNIKLQPLIYPVMKMVGEKITPIKAGGADLTDYSTIKEEVNTGLIRVLEEMRDPSIPFRAPEKTTECRFCKFVDLCMRTDDQQKF